MVRERVDAVLGGDAVEDGLGDGGDPTGGIIEIFLDLLARADKLEVEARDLFRRTMWVLGTNSLARGITDTAIAGGAATALIYGASRVESGAMSLSALLIILMLGIEIFRPMRELRSVLTRKQP